MMNIRHALFGWVVCLFFVHSAIGQQANSAETVDTKVVVTISVDWEGSTLSERNLEAFAKFRDRFPDVPLTQFLNAAYYLRDEPGDAVTEKIKRAIRPADELGLHIHCWRSLVEKSGVAFKTEPTFWGPNIPMREINGDLGHAVELAAYSADEVEKLARTSREVLETGGFDLSKSFRAGGWIATDEVLHGIRKAGFSVDTSAVDRTWHQEEIGERHLYRRLGEVWPNITPHTQPYKIETPAGSVLEMPDTCALADYVSADEMNLHLKEVLDRLSTGQPRFVHIGFHQESAARYIGRVAAFVEKWQGQPGIEFQTLRDAAAIYRSSLKNDAPGVKSIDSSELSAENHEVFFEFVDRTEGSN